MTDSLLPAMPHPLPDVLRDLLDAPAGTAADRAWERLLEQYSGLILHVIRRADPAEDVVMDRYAFVLDAFKRDDHKRLRAFREDGRGKFTTWLVAVVRRLCVDEYRARYGRPQGGDAPGWQSDRRHLVELIADDLLLNRVESAGANPEETVLSEEVQAKLARAVARLSVTQRLILRLRFEDDLSVPEIATLLKYKTPFRLYREIDRILAGLRRELEHAGIRNLAS